MEHNGTPQPSMPSSAPPTAPRLTYALDLGEDASHDGFRLLPTPLTASIEDICAEEDSLRLRYNLPPRGFADSAVRSESEWDALGALRAVNDETTRLGKRYRGDSDNGVSVGYARGFGFNFGLIHYTPEEIRLRKELARQSATTERESDSFTTNIGGGDKADVAQGDSNGELAGARGSAHRACSDSERAATGARNNEEQTASGRGALVRGAGGQINGNDEQAGSCEGAPRARSGGTRAARGAGSNLQRTTAGRSDSQCTDFAQGDCGGEVASARQGGGRNDAQSSMQSAPEALHVGATNAACTTNGSNIEARIAIAAQTVGNGRPSSPAPPRSQEIAISDWEAGASDETIMDVPNLHAQEVVPVNEDDVELRNANETDAPEGVANHYDDDEDDLNIDDDAEVETNENNALLADRHEKLKKSLHSILVRLRQYVPATNGTKEDTLIRERVVSCEIAASYQGPSSQHGIRTVAIYLDIAPSMKLTTTRIACVRFMFARLANDGMALPEDSQIAASCSCSTLVDQVSCEHALLIASSSVQIRSEIKYILGIYTIRSLSPTPDALSAMLLGERKRTTKSSWLVVRHNSFNGCTLNYVPVSESPAPKRGTQTIEKRVNCRRCRLTPEERGLCEHEDAVVSAVRELEKDMQPTGGPEETVYKPNRFESILPRRLFPCESDTFEIQKLATALGKVHEARCGNKEVGADGNAHGGLSRIRIDYEVWDDIRKCYRCGKTLFTSPEKRNCTTHRRECLLHTLLHGTMWIYVNDMVCTSCGAETFFDGRDRALFMVSMRVAYSREILDFLLFHICMLGGTFRASYELLKQTSNSPSARYMRWGGFPLGCKRRTTNNAFGAFLRAIELPEDNVIRNIFSCSTCECVSEDGKRRIEAIVMDGTATGVLGALPTFRRPTLDVPCTADTAPHQFIVGAFYVRKFFSSIFRAAKKCGTSSSFTVDIPARTTAEKAEHILFSGEGRERISEWIAFLFECPSLQDALKARMAGGNELKLKVTFRPKLMRISLRSSAANIFHCFIHEPIPVGLLMSPKHEEAAIAIQMALTEFLNCSHYTAIPNACPELVCPRCCTRLSKSGIFYFDLLPQVCNFIQALCEGLFEGDVQPYRSLVRQVIKLLETSLKVMAVFRKRYSEKESPAARSFTDLYAEPNSAAFRERVWDERRQLEVNSSNDALASGNSSTSCSVLPDLYGRTLSTCEAAKSGELFPGRPLLRPRLRFKNKPEDVCGGCSKEYPFSHRHSPGLFTLQCACDKPKLLGVVVMREAESLATALNSVLTRFDPLPKTVYYDNACNLAKSVRLRFEWVFKETRFLCDRFHYASHTCSGVYDPNSYKFADPSKTSNAEAINRMWKNSRTHVRYLAGRNLIPFIYCRSLFINLRARLKESGSLADVEDKHINTLANSLMPCSCNRCLPPN